MFRLGRLAAMSAVLVMMAGVVSADRLILIPTAKDVSVAAVKAEYAATVNGSGKNIFWVDGQVSRFGAEVAQFNGFSGDNVTAISGQVSLVKEGYFMPAVALGIRDISDVTNVPGLPYRGRALYAVASKGIPGAGGIPILLQDIRFHGGVGTGSLGGLFFGAEGTLPLGVHVSGEYDTKNINFAVSKSILPALSVQLTSLNQDLYYGATFSSSF